MDKKVKGLVAINDILDDRYKKLCDKYHDLQLSHNRKKKCLQSIFKYLCFLDAEFERHSLPMLVNPYSLKNMITDIESALFCDGREKVRIKK